MKLIFATNNSHKLAEIRDMLKGRFELLGLADINFFDEIPENEKTLEGNALSKARHIYNKVHCECIAQKDKVSCFADDTGLEVEALNGAPGVYSARYSGESFSSEKERSESNIRKLLRELNGKKNLKARFRTVIAYIHNGEEVLFEGIVNGQIIYEKRGNEGFGYDPVFVPDGYAKTFAEMTMQEKSEISHRARAFKKFTSYLISK